MIADRCIIVASGASIRENLWYVPINELPIWKALKNEITIGINWSSTFYTPTVALFGDYKFYHTQFDSIKHLPLLVSTKDAYYIREGHQPILDNLFLLERCKIKKYLKAGDKTEGIHKYYWGKDSWKQGWYTNQLSGLMALTFAINGLGAKEIFLLGYDASGINGHTHFYDDTNVGSYVYDNSTTCGVGIKENGLYRTDNYNKTDKLNNFWFKPFEQEWDNGVRIYNVSLNSKIDTFLKISYKAFYAMLKNNVYPVNQDEIFLFTLHS